MGEITESESPFCYVGSNPVKRIDPDGKTWGDALVGLAVAVIDNVSGLDFRGAYHPANAGDYNHGQDAGDFASVLIGDSEMGTGAGLTTTAAVATVGTGGLAIEVTAPAAGFGAALATHGAITAGRGTANFAAQKGRVQEKPSHQSSSGAATDSKGNKLGPSGKPQVNTVNHSSMKKAKDAARAEGKKAPVKHVNPQKGGDHYHATDKKGKKMENSTHHEF